MANAPPAPAPHLEVLHGLQLGAEPADGAIAQVHRRTATGRVAAAELVHVTHHLGRLLIPGGAAAAAAAVAAPRGIKGFFVVSVRHHSVYVGVNTSATCSLLIWCPHQGS
jgi:hypothetical protein